MTVTVDSPRRVRRRKAATTKPLQIEEAKASAEALVKLEAKLLKLQQTFEEAKKETFVKMQEAQALSLETSSGPVVQIETPAGRGSTTVDPEGFRKKVTEEEFFGCISVSVTKAKAIIGEKELQKVSTWKEPVPGKPHLVIKHPKTPKKRV